MQRITIWRSTYGTGTITRHYQWKRRIWSGRNQETLKEGMENSILGILERLWEWTWSIDSRNRVTSCKRGDWRLLDKNFKSKSIKEGGETSISTNLNLPRNKCLIKPPTTWPHPPSQTYTLPGNSITWKKLG